MPDNGRFSDREIERDLRDLGARIEYPPTPDLAQAVRRRIDEEDAVQHTPRGGFWPSFFSLRWAATAAALVLIAVAAFSPAVRATLSDLFVSGEAANSGHQAEDGSEAGGSAARPEGGGPEDAGSSVASGAKASSADEVTGCPSPSLEAEPAKAAPEANFRLHGAGFSSGCDKARPAQDIRLDFRQDEETWKLATVDADQHLTFDTRLRVPAGARPGQATVRATTRSGELVEEHFVVSR